MSTDEEVIRACRTYLRGACGDSLDQMEGSNYQVTWLHCIYLCKLQCTIPLRRV